MNPFVVGLDDVLATDRKLVGGKGAALAKGRSVGFFVPRTLCITTHAYRRFVESGRLDGAIAMEIDRKDFADMRWEELWDAALRIRNLFLNTALPHDVRDSLTRDLEKGFSCASLAIRSSSVAEDSGGASFAGLHESYVNVTADPVENVLDHVKLVWASLWSDRALLYRQELGLDVSGSAMAVVVQELVDGDASGVLFTCAPNDPDHMMIEAVYGLNAGLVDGSVAPDRWLLDRAGRSVIRHDKPGERMRLVAKARGDVVVERVPSDLGSRPPLCMEQLQSLGRAGLDLEGYFGAAQDVEWTVRGAATVLLQCRPITVGSGAVDERSWYLSLHRSFENLRGLRKRVEEELIPAMDADAAKESERNPVAMSERELDAAIARRREIVNHWEAAYREDCIPLAHGVRLFGEIYNDTVRPSDPFEFVLLLTGTPMESLSRNRDLEELAALSAEPLEGPREKEFDERSRGFLVAHGDTVFGALVPEAREEALKSLLRRYRGAERTGKIAAEGQDELKERFLRLFPRGRDEAEGLLDLARASYRLRDDDNIHLGRIRLLLQDAVAERFRRRGDGATDEPAAEKTDSNDPAHSLLRRTPPRSPRDPRSRQIVGQPASRGIGHGRARVVATPQDLQGFQPGEILVCDAIDPTMTYVCPLAAGIVERRGGMLIHGAIIAREYGIPCVTGVPGATRKIRTGDRVTVDGFLGIVVVQQIST